MPTVGGNFTRVSRDTKGKVFLSRLLKYTVLAVCQKGTFKGDVPLAVSHMNISK